MLYEYVPQCQRVKPVTKHRRHVGCMLWGALNVNQVAGIIHIATRTGQVDSLGRARYDRESLESLLSNHFIRQ